MVGREIEGKKKEEWEGKDKDKNQTSKEIDFTQAIVMRRSKHQCLSSAVLP